MAAVEVPPGIFPVFLTMTTQEKFNIVSGTDVTAEAPHKRLPVRELLKDISFRGVISDWQPAKGIIEKYKNGDLPQDQLEILVVLDDENVYGQNFYMCFTEEAAEAVIAKFAQRAEEAGAAGEEEAAEEEEPRPKEMLDPDLINRPWIEMDVAPRTTAEIDEMRVRDVEVCAPS